MRELDERADALSLTSLVPWRGSTQSSTHVREDCCCCLFFESVAGVAPDFSSVLAAQALAFKAEDVALEQSWAM